MHWVMLRADIGIQTVPADQYKEREKDKKEESAFKSKEISRKH